MSKRETVNARRLDERITFQRRSDNQDAATGIVTTTWTNHVECWAAVDAEPVVDRVSHEQYVSRQERAISLITFWIRADVFTRFALTQEMRISWRGQVFDVIALSNQQLRGRLTSILGRAGLSSSGI